MSITLMGIEFNDHAAPMKKASAEKMSKHIHTPAADATAAKRAKR